MAHRSTRPASKRRISRVRRRLTRAQIRVKQREAVDALCQDIGSVDEFSQIVARARPVHRQAVYNLILSHLPLWLYLEVREKESRP